MVNPQFEQLVPVALVDVKGILEKVEARDKELNYRSNKCKDYVEHFVTVSEKQRKQLQEKLTGLALTRLKEEHIMKIIDFLPKTTEELKVVLQAYPLSMPKKDMDAIVAVVKESQ